MKDFKFNWNQYKNHFSNSKEVQYSVLRMYCHMLDKGMNNPNFERGHSIPIYQKAVEIKRELKVLYGNDRCFKWIDEILERFQDAQESGAPALVTSEPKEYTEQEIEEHTKFIKRRTSCRNFIDKKIPQSVISQIIDIAIDAPNGCCRQVVRYYITQNKEKISQLVPHIAGITNFSNIQCVVCVAAESSYYDLQDKNLQFVDASLSAENFILGASLYGIYGTMCNFFHATADDIAFCKNLLNINQLIDTNLYGISSYQTSKRYGIISNFN